MARPSGPPGILGSASPGLLETCAPSQSPAPAPIPPHPGPSNTDTAPLGCRELVGLLPPRINPKVTMNFAATVRSQMAVSGAGSKKVCALLRGRVPLDTVATTPPRPRAPRKDPARTTTRASISPPSTRRFPRSCAPCGPLSGDAGRLWRIISSRNRLAPPRDLGCLGRAKRSARRTQPRVSDWARSTGSPSP